MAASVNTSSDHVLEHAVARSSERGPGGAPDVDTATELRKYLRGLLDAEANSAAWSGSDSSISTGPGIDLSLRASGKLLHIEVERRRGARRAGARWRLRFRSRSRGAGGARGETGGALGPVGGFTSGPGRAARAEARRGARWGSAADSRQVQVSRRGRRRGVGRAGARRRLHLRSRSRGAGGGETGGMLGLGGGFTAGPGHAARAEAGRAARWGPSAASLEVQVAWRGRRRGAERAGARRRLLFRSLGAGGGGTTGALGPVGGFSSGLAARAEVKQAASWGSAAASLQVQVARGGRRRDRRRAGAYRRLLVRSRSRDAGGGEARSALGLGGGFTWGPGRAVRAEARRAARRGSVAASLEVQVTRRGRRRDGRRAGVRRRLHLRSRSRGAGGGEARSALGPVGGFSSGPGRSARAEAGPPARWGPSAASLPVRVARRGRRSRSRGAGGGEARSALGPVGGFSSGPGLAARAEARRWARWGSAAARQGARRAGCWGPAAHVAGEA
eukprot:tig00020878_g14855.t2